MKCDLSFFCFHWLWCAEEWWLWPIKLEWNIHSIFAFIIIIIIWALAGSTVKDQKKEEEEEENKPLTSSHTATKCNNKDSLENFDRLSVTTFHGNYNVPFTAESRRIGSNLRLPPSPAGKWSAPEPQFSPDIRLTAPLLLDTHSWQHSAKDTRRGHFSKTPRRFRHLAKAQTLRRDMLTCNSRVTPQHWAAILNETKLAERNDR